MTGALKRLWTEESGQGLAEYGLILGLVAVAAIVALGVLGGGASDLIDAIGEKLSGVSVP